MRIQYGIWDGRKIIGWANYLDRDFTQEEYDQLRKEYPEYWRIAPSDAPKQKKSDERSPLGGLAKAIYEGQMQEARLAPKTSEVQRLEFIIEEKNRIISVLRRKLEKEEEFVRELLGML